jgi:hypothetical protein
VKVLKCKEILKRKFKKIINLELSKTQKKKLKINCYNKNNLLLFLYLNKLNYKKIKRKSLYKIYNYF